MSTAANESTAGRRFGLAGWILVVFLFQLSLIYWLSDRSEKTSRPPRPVPVLRPAGPEYVDLLAVASPAIHKPPAQAHAQLLALENPSMFALPHPESFSGEAWMQIGPPVYRAFDWNEAPRWLPLQLPPMEEVLTKLAPAKTHSSDLVAILGNPELNEPGMLRLKFLPTASALRILASQPDIIDGPIPQLPAQVHSDLLTNTVVQVAINSEGQAFSATLLGSSGLRSADEDALRIARALKYKADPTVEVTSAVTPVPNRWARLVFEWHTVPTTGTTNSGGKS